MSSSDPNTCRRSAKSRNVSESSDTSLSSSNSKNDVTSSSRQFRCPADPSGLSDGLGPDRIRRKKRRKSIDDSKNIICKRVSELSRQKELEKKLISLKLKNSRQPVVLLTRVDHNGQLKNKSVVENKVEEEKRVQLHGLTIPAKVDPRILNNCLVVKINKKQTENLIEINKRLSQNQAKAEASNYRQEVLNSDSLVVSSESNKCTDRLKLKNIVSDDKCTKNFVAKNNSGRQKSVDKINDRLPEKLLEDNSKCVLNSIAEGTTDVTQSECSKNLIHNTRRLKRNSIDQINSDKFIVDSVENKSKCIENAFEGSSKKYLEASIKDVAKNSKNSVNDSENHSRLVIDKNSKKQTENSGLINETLIPFSHKEDKKSLKKEIKDSSKISNVHGIIENTRRQTRNSVSQNNEKDTNNLMKDSCSDSLHDQKIEKLPEKVDKHIQNISTDQTDNQKIITQNAIVISENYFEKTVEKNSSSTEKSVEHSRKKLCKKVDKRIEGSKNETENDKEVSKTNDNYDRHNESCNDNHATCIEDNTGHSNKHLEKSNKSIKDSIKYTERSKRITRNTIVCENNVQSTQIVVKESNAKQSQSVHTDLQKSSKNIDENIRKVRRNSNTSIHFVEENSENHCKNIENKVDRLPKKSMQHNVEDKNKSLSNSLDEKVTNLSDKTVQPPIQDGSENVSNVLYAKISKKSENTSFYNLKIFDEKLAISPKIPIFNDIQTRKAFTDKVTNETTIKNKADCTQNHDTELNKKQDNVVAKQTNSKGIIAKKIRPKRSITTKVCPETNSLSSAQNSLNDMESSTETMNDLTENSNKNIDKTISLLPQDSDHIKNSMDNNLGYTKHVIDKNVDKVPIKLNTKIKKDLKVQTDIAKRTRRKVALQKNGKQLENVTKTSTELKQFSRENKKIPNEVDTNSRIHNKIQTEKMVATRNSSFTKDERQADNLTKNNDVRSVLNTKEEKGSENNTETKIKSITSDTIKKSLRNSSDKLDKSTKSIVKNNADKMQNVINKQEELHTVIKECSKSQVENYKRVTRKSSAEKHDRSSEKTMDVDSTESQISFENKLLNEQHKFVKENSKAAKSSYNKCEVNATNIKIDSNCVQNVVEKSNDKVREESRKTIKECFKIQSEIYKKFAKKTLPEKIEKSTETLIVNNSDSTQNSDNVNSDSLSERLDNKENSKMQIDLNTRITRNSSYKKDKNSKNLIENNVDCTQSVIEENKEKCSENVVQKMSLRNMADSKMLRNCSSEKTTDTRVENSNEKNVSTLQNLFEENNEQQTNNVDNKVIKSIVDSENYVAPNNHSEEFPAKNSETTTESSKRITRKSSEKLNLSLTEQKNSSKNNELFSEKINHSKVDKIDEINVNESSVDKISVDNLSIDVCSQILKESEKVEEVCLKATKNNLQSDIHVSAEELREHLEILLDKCEENQENLITENNKVDYTNLELTVNSSETMAVNLPSENEKEQESILEKNECLDVFTYTVIDKKQSEELNEIEKGSLTKEDDSEILPPLNDLLRDISEDHAIIDDTLAQDDSNKLVNKNYNENSENEIEQYSNLEAINSNYIHNSTDNQLHNTNELSVEKIFRDDTRKLIDKLIEETCNDESQNFNNDIEENLDTLIELNEMLDYSSGEIINNDINAENNFENISISDNNLFTETLRNIDNSSDKFIQTPLETKTVQNYMDENTKLSVENSLINNVEACPKNWIDDESLAKTRRQLTLIELKRKCTENLDKKRSAILKSDIANSSNSVSPNSSPLNDDHLASSERSTDSCIGNVTESEENYPECLSDGPDSDENLADRLAHTNGYTTPVHSAENADSGIEIASEHQRVNKIVLKCPRTRSFLEMNADFECKHCGTCFTNSREMKKHVKEHHRQRLVIKITKTDVNKHVTHMVEPVLNPKSRNDEIISNENAVLSIPTECEQSSQMFEQDREEAIGNQITEGEIKIIVKKESGSKNSHVVKEIKITPKTPDTSKLTVNSDKSNSNSPNNWKSNCSQSASEVVQCVKRRPGRPRKYPIFTESQMIAKELANTSKKKPNDQASLTSAVDERTTLFEPIVSIIESTSSAVDEKSIKSITQPDEPASIKRKRNSSQETKPELDNTVVHEEKRYKLEEEKKSESGEPCLAQHGITKRLVVRLTKIDTVTKDDKEEYSVAIDHGSDEVNSLVKTKRKTKSKVHQEEKTLNNQETIKAIVKINLRKKLENNNNNNLKNVEKNIIDTSESHATSSISTASKITPNEQVDERTHEPDTNTPDIGETIDNQKSSLDSQMVVTPRNQTIDMDQADESQKAKLLMLMNATTPQEAENNIVTSTVTETSPTELQPSEIETTQQYQQQQQLQQQPQPQQFCILFIPDSLYGPDAGLTKDSTPTATLVNFQPVPDNEIANKSLVYTPTVPTGFATPVKISHEEQSRLFVCATCNEVSDLIGRLEASLGMTEEDKSAIKCPYCSNHFQSLFYLEYHVRQEHLKCENEKTCRHSGLNSLRIPNLEATSEFESYITFALKCRSCYDVFGSVLMLNDHVMHRHKSLVRLRPNPTLPSSPTTFAGKNGGRPMVLQCPSDCVCRIGIRNTDSPLQRQQMLKRCPNAMRRLEKIEPAAYEVYTCILCKSTFLMKDEVVDHLMKMHEVSCKFPCYTCLINYRSLQMQESHRCTETTLQDLDKILSIAILPGNVGSKDDNNKFLEREDSSNDEYGSIKGGSPTTPVVAAPVGSRKPGRPGHSNGFKRKNIVSVGMLMQMLGISPSAKQPKVGPGTSILKANGRPKRKKHCPKCKKRFAYRKSLHDHIIHDHIIMEEGTEGPKKAAIELLALITNGKSNGQRADEVVQMLKAYKEPNMDNLSVPMMMDGGGRDQWMNTNESGSELRKEDITQCSRCKGTFKISSKPSNHKKQNDQHLSSEEANQPILCENCENGGPKTRRRSNVNNGYKLKLGSDTLATQHAQSQYLQPFPCKKCSESFANAVELKNHKRIAHLKVNDKLYQCDLCKKSFASPRMLDKHKKLHREIIFDDAAKSDKNEIKPRSPRPNDTIDNSDAKCDSSVNDNITDKADTSTSRRDSSDSSSVGSKKPEEPLNCTFCEEICSSKVSLKNHLKREHGRRASICQLCNGLLIDTNEVRHMLDYHIVPSKSSSRRAGSPRTYEDATSMRADVDELVRTLGKHRLQSLMMYHDFEGKCNNAIMRCPICPELFATRESCRFHYVWIHDVHCLLCDKTFRSGSSACQHKVDAHTSTVSYLWCIHRLVSAIVSGLRLDPDQPSHILYQLLAMRFEQEEELAAQPEGSIAEKNDAQEVATSTERFLEEVVLSEDQLPDSGNMIEVVIGKEDSEDDLLSMLNLSPNYESCEQHRIPNAGAAPPEEEEDEDTTTAIASAPSTPLLAGTPSLATSPIAETYVASGVCKYRLENDEEQLVLVVTDEDLVTYRDDIESLAERISVTCDSLTLDEITEMLRAYFENVSASNGTGA